jgi:hypothetical protein
LSSLFPSIVDVGSILFMALMCNNSHRLDNIAHYTSPKLIDTVALASGTKGLSVLKQDYVKDARQLIAMGFNGPTLNFELLRAEELKRLDREEAWIQVLTNSRGMNQAETLFKTGITIINGHTLLGAHRILEENTVKGKEDKAKVEAEKLARSDIEAILFFLV